MIHIQWKPPKGRQQRATALLEIGYFVGVEFAPDGQWPSRRTSRNICSM
jgi:hypothetical protein